MIRSFSRGLFSHSFQDFPTPWISNVSSTGAMASLCVPHTQSWTPASSSGAVTTITRFTAKPRKVHRLMGLAVALDNTVSVVTACASDQIYCVLMEPGGSGVLLGPAPEPADLESSSGPGAATVQVQPTGGAPASETVTNSEFATEIHRAPLRLTTGQNNVKCGIPFLNTMEQNTTGSPMSIRILTKDVVCPVFQWRRVQW